MHLPRLYRQIFRWADGKRSSHNSAKVGLDDRGREHRSLASLCRVVVPTPKRNRKETL